MERGYNPSTRAKVHALHVATTDQSRCSRCLARCLPTFFLPEFSLYSTNINAPTVKFHGRTVDYGHHPSSLTMAELHRAFNRTLNVAYVDVKAAFNSVDRDKSALWKALQGCGLWSSGSASSDTGLV